VNTKTKWHLPFFLAVIGDVTGNTVEVEVVEGAGISGNAR
jgi:predicted component of type VI protein secretion system